MSEKKHSPIGASSSYRWTNCPGSVALSEKAPPKESSDAADEGTAAHMLLEACILDATHARNFLGQVFNKFKVTEEMADAVQTCVDWTFKKRDEMGGLIEVEREFDLSSLYPGLYGTNDINIFKKGKRLVVCDYKHGQNSIEVKENKQLLFYALGAAIVHNYEFDDVEMVIVQPRCSHPAGPVRSWVVNKDYLISWSRTLVEAAKLTQSPGAPLYRGDWCKYCPAKGICPKQSEAVEKALDISTQNVIQLPTVATLTDQQVTRILEAKKQIEDFISEVQRSALHRLQSGETIEGLKLVAGRASRIWLDEGKATTYLIERLGEGAFTKKLLTPAATESVLPKKDIEHMWISVSGGETVAPASDRRKEIKALEGTLKLSKKGAI